MRPTHPLLALACALLVLLPAGCAGNVRWKHPTPDRDLLSRMLSDIQGFHAADGNDREDDPLLPPEEARAILAGQRAPDEDTPAFQFVEVQGRILTITGYGRYFMPGDDLSLPRRRYIYRYVGELTHAAYALRHMAPAVCDLRLHSRPIQPLAFTWVDGGADHGTTQVMKFDGGLSADCHYSETAEGGTTPRYGRLSGHQPYTRGSLRARWMF